jgi:hypothetical protein
MIVARFKIKVGGVAIYVKENIYCEEKVELKQNGLESI